MIANSQLNPIFTERPAPNSERSSFQLGRSTPYSINAQRLLAARGPRLPNLLSRHEFNRLLAVAGGHPETRDLRDIVTIIFHTGLRLGEVAKLRWKDIDFNTRQMLICNVKGQERVVPFGRKVQQLLELRGRLQPSSESILGKNPQISLNRAIRNLQELSPFVRSEPVNFHLLRRTFMRRWMSAGGDPTLLAHITGSAIPHSTSADLRSPDSMLADEALFQEQLEEADE